jgi:hypothetical protein
MADRQNLQAEVLSCSVTEMIGDAPLNGSSLDRMQIETSGTITLRLSRVDVLEQAISLHN